VRGCRTRILHLLSRKKCTFKTSGY